MILETLRESLHKGLSIVLPAVAVKSTLPVLSHVQLTADDSGLWLAATNLEVGIKTRIGAKVEQHGSVCLPAKLLAELIGGLPNVPVSMALNDKSQVVSIRAGTFKAELHGIEADEFPVLVTSGNPPAFEMIGSDWHVAIDTVAMSADTGIGRPVLTGVHIHTKEGVTFEASDGFRLSRKRFDIDSVIDTIIPATSLTMARKAFSADATVSISMTNNGAMALFDDGTTVLSSRVIDGQYPDIDRIIPAKYTTRIIVPVADLLSRLKLTRYVAQSSSNIVRLDVTTLADRDGKLGITANTAEIADLNDTIDVIASGESVAIALNINYLLDAVGACGSGDVAIELQSPQHPAVMRATGDDTMLQLCMPMTIR